MPARTGLARSVAVLALAVAVAVPQASAQPVQGAPPVSHVYRAPYDGHIEGHIAFLRAELKITPSQEPLFATLAAAMRDDVNNYDEVLRQSAAGLAIPTNALHIL